MVNPSVFCEFKPVNNVNVPLAATSAIWRKHPIPGPASPCAKIKRRPETIAAMIFVERKIERRCCCVKPLSRLKIPKGPSPKRINVWCVPMEVPLRLIKIYSLNPNDSVQTSASIA